MGSRATEDFVVATAETILMLGDLLHYSDTARSINGVSSTANGYNKDYVRDTSWGGAWKPSDGTSDEYIMCDGADTSWVGAFGEQATLAIAYDARGCDQNTIVLRQDTADSPVGTFTTIRSTITVNKTAPTVDFVQFLVSSGGRRYYRLLQGNADRGGGTKTIPIYAWAMFHASGVYSIDSEYTADAPSEGAYEQVSQAGMFQSVGGLHASNKNGRTYYEFDVNFARASVGLWTMIRDKLDDIGGPARCFWMQYEGLKNAAKSHFQMVRQARPRWGSTRPYVDLYDTSVRFQTEPAPL